MPDLYDKLGSALAPFNARQEEARKVERDKIANTLLKLAENGKISITLPLPAWAPAWLRSQRVQVSKARTDPRGHGIESLPSYSIQWDAPHGKPPAADLGAELNTANISAEILKYLR